MAMENFVWVPESLNHQGVYATTSECSGHQNCTRVFTEALKFKTKEECQAWCDRNPIPAFKPVEHGYIE